LYYVKETCYAKLNNIAITWPISVKYMDGKAAEACYNCKWDQTLPASERRNSSWGYCWGKRQAYASPLCLLWS